MRPLLTALALGTGVEHALRVMIVLVAASGDAFAVFAGALVLSSLAVAPFVDRAPRALLVAAKALEVVLVGAAAIAFWLTPGGGLFGLAALAGLGARSALFGAAGSALLPEVLSRDRLLAGNGALLAGAVAAIAVGAGIGGFAVDFAGPRLAVVPLLALALVGLVAVRRVPEASTATAAGGSLRAALTALRGGRDLRLAALGAAFAGCVAGIVAQATLGHAQQVLDLAAPRTALPLVAAAVGFALAASLAGRLSHVEVEIGWIPLGTLVIVVATAGIAAFAPGFESSLFWLAALGAGVGLVVVPIQTLLQLEAPSAARGAVLALVHAVAFAGALAGVLACDWARARGISMTAVFGVVAAGTSVGLVWAVALMPRAGVRLLLVLLTWTLYRLRVRGRENVPADGPALLVCNHVSFVDGLLLSASIDRPIRFLVERAYYERPLLKPFMKLFGFVPIASESSPRELLESLRRAGEALDRGELVCIFAEGEITRTGQLLPFRRGFERITKGRHVPVLPVHLDRVWGSLASFAGSGLVRAILGLPRPITVSFGSPEPSGVPAPELRARVSELDAAAWRARVVDAEPLHAEFVRRARLGPWRFAVGGATSTRVSRLGLLVKAVAAARALRGAWRDQSHVGVALPPSVAGAVVNVAASLAGRTVVNLNFTAGRAALASAVRQAELRTVVTSREFLDKTNIELPDELEIVEAERIAAMVGAVGRVVAAVAAVLAPRRLLERICGAPRAVRGTDAATVIFSSGSTGAPKGIVLSHFNLCANAAAVRQALPFSDDDRVLGTLPLFHSFGTLALWFSLRNGLAIAFWPNPLDAAAVGALVERHALTVMIATPTFLQLYTRRCSPGQLGSLRHVIVGAEKLPLRVADAFEERFGVRPLEGYGTTECSPVIAVNAPGFRARGLYQAASRRGSVGRPLPGVAVRVRDHETGELLPQGETGVLEISGANVMEGYLGRPELTAEALRDGWYSTGDIARVDEDGYVTITDRLSRFSKIGGEMVPHGVVEAALHEAAGVDDLCFAVTGVPCERKGERLVVLHTLDEERIPAVLAALETKGLPNLYVPKVDAFVHVDALPLLGTGKLDLRAIREIAAESVL